MIRQYYASPFQGGDNPLRVGVVAAGAIVYLQPDAWWRGHGQPNRHDPYIVEGFLNGTLAAARRDPGTGRWVDAVVSHRSDQAMTRSLRTGRRRVVAVRLLALHEDHGFAVPGGYPSLPDLRFYRAKPAMASPPPPTPLPARIATDRQAARQRSARAKPEPVA